MALTPIQGIIVTTALVTWGASIAAGLVALHNYENTPGRLDITQRHWPADTELRFSSGRCNVVMLAHPRCPCTRASLDELRRLLNRSEVRMTAHVLFWMPSHADHSWEQTELWKMAASMPGVEVHADENGDEARRFGATTSGHVIVFQADGTKVFSGGLTMGRGRVGNSGAATAIWKLINQKKPLRTDLPVFGCQLFDLQATCNDGDNPCPQ